MANKPTPGGRTTRMHRAYLPKNFTNLPNHIADDGRISFAAKGMLFYLLSRPHDWECRKGSLYEVGPDGRRGADSAIAELVEAGYVLLSEQDRDARGWRRVLVESTIIPTVFDDDRIARILEHEEPWPEGLSPADLRRRAGQPARAASTGQRAERTVDDGEPTREMNSGQCSERALDPPEPTRETRDNQELPLQGLNTKGVEPSLFEDEPAVSESCERKRSPRRGAQGWKDHEHGERAHALVQRCWEQMPRPRPEGPKFAVLVRNVADFLADDVPEADMADALVSTRVLGEGGLRVQLQKLAEQREREAGHARRGRASASRRAVARPADEGRTAVYTASIRLPDEIDPETGQAVMIPWGIECTVDADGDLVPPRPMSTQRPRDRSASHEAWKVWCRAKGVAHRGRYDYAVWGQENAAWIAERYPLLAGVSFTSAIAVELALCPWSEGVPSFEQFELGPEAKAFVAAERKRRYTPEWLANVRTWWRDTLRDMAHLPRYADYTGPVEASSYATPTVPDAMWERALADAGECE